MWNVCQVCEINHCHMMLDSAQVAASFSSWDPGMGFQAIRPRGVHCMVYNLPLIGCCFYLVEYICIKICSDHVQCNALFLYKPSSGQLSTVVYFIYHWSIPETMMLF